MTQIGLELPDGTVLEGNLVTVALAFLMHEYAPVAFPQPDLGAFAEAVAALKGLADDQPGAEQSVDDLPPELRDPQAFAHLTP